jgi:hypothetical protein
MIWSWPEINSNNIDSINACEHKHKNLRVYSRRRSRVKSSLKRDQQLEEYRRYLFNY